ncbi:MAG: metallophosphoesterase [Acidobacteriota bacterium]|nr:metallophosphoesterase [Acidobacteriota bacterium]
MKKIRLLHAADLHLGAPMECLPGELGAAERALCAGATHAAWRQLVQVAVEEEVDLVVLAGDTLDGEAPLEARRWLVEGLEELAAEEIPTVLVAGEGDCLSSSVWSGFELPAGSTLLTPEHPEFLVRRGGRVVVSVVGYSRDPAVEGSRLPSARRRDPEHEDAVQVAVRHGTVTAERRVGDLRGALRLREVERSGLDAWLLGSAHRHRTWSEADPLIHDPGCAQARWPRETGLRGCSLIEWADGRSRPPKCRFRPLGPVAWHAQAVELSTAQTLESEVRRVVQEIDGELPREVELVLLHLSVRGGLASSRSRFENALRKALGERFGDRVILGPPAMEVLPTPAREGIPAESFAEAVLEEQSRAGTEGGQEALRATVQELLDRAGLPEKIWPAELAPAQNLEELLSLATAEALWALTLEDA